MSPSYVEKVELPTEIVFTIFEFLVLSLKDLAENSEIVDRNRTWSSCALVCTTWSPVARRFQFENLELRLGVQPDPAAVSRLERTMAVFRSNPALSGYIRAICLSGTQKYEAYDRSNMVVVENIAKACSLMSELRLDPIRFHQFELSTLSFASWRFSQHTTREAVAEGIENVLCVSQKLKLDDIVFRSEADFIQLVRLGHAHNLKELDMRLLKSNGGRLRESTLFGSQDLTLAASPLRKGFESVKLFRLGSLGVID